MMKAYCAALSITLVFAMTCASAYAVTLEASVSKSDLDDVTGQPEKHHHKKHSLLGRIGVRIDCIGHIARVRPGSPAELAGLQANDKVLLVDGRKHAIDDIMGEPGTTVMLDVKRKSDRFQVAVERIDVSAIRYY